MKLARSEPQPLPLSAPIDRVLLEVVGDAGVSNEQLSSQVARQESRGRRGLWGAACDLLGSSLGVAVGTRLSDPRWAGMPALVVRAADNLHDGLSRLQAVRPFMLGGTRLAVRARRGRVGLGFDPPGRPWPAPVAEALVVSMLTAGHRWTGVAFPATSLTFRHAVSKESLRALKTFTEDVRGCQSENGLEFSSACLDLPFVHADPQLAGLLHAMLPKQHPSSGLRGAVGAAIRDSLRQGRGTTAEVARSMGMSMRTLQRKLHPHGVSVFQLMEVERIGLTKELLLEPHLSLRAIAEQVGFSDERSLRRAFTRATGETAAAYRRAANATA